MHLYLICHKTELTHCFSRQKEKKRNKYNDQVNVKCDYTISYWGFPSSPLTFEVFEVTFLWKLIINLSKVFFLQVVRAVNVKGRQIRTEDKSCLPEARCL